MMVFSAILEFFSLSAVVPFLGILIAPSSDFQFTIGTFTLTIIDQNINFIIVSFFLVFIFSAIFRFLTLRFSFVLAGNIGYELSKLSFGNYINQSYLSIASTNSSEIVSILIHSMDRTVRSCIAFFNLITTFVITLFIVVALLLIDFELSLSIILTVLITYLLIARFNRQKLIKNSKLATAAISNQILIINETLGAIKQIIFTRAQHSYVDKYSSIDTRLRKAQSNNAFMTSCPRFIIEPIALITIFSAVLINSKDNSSLSSSLPVIAAVVFGFQKILPASQQIYVSWSTIKSFIQDISKVLVLLNLQRDKSRALNPRVDTNPILSFTSIEVNDLYFTYPNKSYPSIKNLSLSLPVSSKVGLIGTSGSGKSTFVDLLLSILYPDRGSISLKSKSNLTNTPSNSPVTNFISYVPQTPFFIDSSILENITGETLETSVNLPKFYDALEVASLTGLVNNYDQGIFFNIGENGCNLSGGQLQRLSIARAVYSLRDTCPILILDEATSALDIETESIIMNKLTKIKNLTLISIAHRLQSLKSMDLILELSDGQIVRSLSNEEFNSEVSSYTYHSES